MKKVIIRYEGQQVVVVVVVAAAAAAAVVVVVVLAGNPKLSRRPNSLISSHRMQCLSQFTMHILICIGILRWSSAPGQVLS